MLSSAATSLLTHILDTNQHHLFPVLADEVEEHGHARVADLFRNRKESNSFTNRPHRWPQEGWEVDESGLAHDPEFHLNTSVKKSPEIIPDVHMVPGWASRGAKYGFHLYDLRKPAPEREDDESHVEYGQRVEDYLNDNHPKHFFEYRGDIMKHKEPQKLELASETHNIVGLTKGGDCDCCGKKEIARIHVQDPDTGLITKYGSTCIGKHFNITPKDALKHAAHVENMWTAGVVARRAIRKKGTLGTLGLARVPSGNLGQRRKEFDYGVSKSALDPDFSNFPAGTKELYHAAKSGDYLSHLVLADHLDEHGHASLANRLRQLGTKSIKTAFGSHDDSWDSQMVAHIKAAYDVPAKDRPYNPAGHHRHNQSWAFAKNFVLKPFTHREQTTDDEGYHVNGDGQDQRDFLVGSWNDEWSDRPIFNMRYANHLRNPGTLRYGNGSIHQKVFKDHAEAKEFMRSSMEHARQNGHDATHKMLSKLDKELDKRWGEKKVELARADVLADSSSQQQKSRMYIAAKIAREARLKLDLLKSVRSESQAGVLQRITHNNEPEAVNYIAAYYGLLANQPRMATFHVGEGPDTLHTWQTQQNPDHLLRQAAQMGIGHLNVSDDGYVIALDKQSNNPMAIQKLKESSNAVNPSAERGASTILGGRESPAANRKHYRDTIQAYEQSP